MKEELEKALEAHPDNPFLEGHVEALTNEEESLRDREILHQDAERWREYGKAAIREKLEVIEILRELSGLCERAWDGMLIGKPIRNEAVRLLRKYPLSGGGVSTADRHVLLAVVDEIRLESPRNGPPSATATVMLFDGNGGQTRVEIPVLSIFQKLDHVSRYVVEIKFRKLAENERFDPENA